MQGRVDVLGTADGTGFAGYLLEYAAGDQPGDANTVWQPVAPPAAQPVSGGLLAQWQTGQLTPGVYMLRLKVYDTSGAVYSALVRVNVAP